MDLFTLNLYIFKVVGLVIFDLLAIGLIGTVFQVVTKLFKK